MPPMNKFSNFCAEGTEITNRKSLNPDVLHMFSSKRKFETGKKLSLTPLTHFRLKTTNQSASVENRSESKQTKYTL